MLAFTINYLDLGNLYDHKEYEVMSLKDLDKLLQRLLLLRKSRLNSLKVVKRQRSHLQNLYTIQFMWIDLLSLMFNLTVSLLKI